MENGFKSSGKVESETERVEEGAKRVIDKSKKEVRATMGEALKQKADKTTATMIKLAATVSLIGAIILYGSTKSIGRSQGQAPTPLW